LQAKTQHVLGAGLCYTKVRMALFVNQKDNRTELQQKVAADLAERLKNHQPIAGKDPDVGNGILEDSQEATGRSLFWVGVVTMLVVALVVFVLIVFNDL
jgi:hypothetical protein